MFDVWLGILVLFLCYFSYSDIIYRKISNLSLGIFFMFFLIWSYVTSSFFSFSDALWALFFIFLFWFFHYKHIWGAGDGKLAIILSLFLIANSSYVLVFDAMISLVLVYSLFTLLFSLSRTSFSEKKKVLYSLPYQYLFSYTLSIVAFLALLYQGISYFQLSMSFEVLIGFFILVLLFSKFFKKVYDALDENSLIVVGFISFSYGLYQWFSDYVSVFVISFTIRTIISYLSSLSDRLDGKKRYYAPFAVYISLAFFIEFIFEKNILILLLELL
jgi:Flp pilus assembly protein protease CpaA